MVWTRFHGDTCEGCNYIHGVQTICMLCIQSPGIPGKKYVTWVWFRQQIFPSVVTKSVFFGFCVCSGWLLMSINFWNPENSRGDINIVLFQLGLALALCRSASESSNANVTAWRPWKGEVWALHPISAGRGQAFRRRQNSTQCTVWETQWVALPLLL